MSTSSNRQRAVDLGLKLEYDPALPITAHRNELIEALARLALILLL
jgi:hypothetical protein